MNQLGAPPAQPPSRDELGHAEAHATLNRILGAIEEYVYTGESLADDSYRLVFAGPCREQFLGMSIQDAGSAVWADYVHPLDMGVFDTAHDGAHQTGILDVEYRLVGADGRVRWVRDRGRMRAEHGRRFLDGSVLDVTAIKLTQGALEAARAEAHRLAQVDPLTGVYNRRSLGARLEALGGEQAGVLTVDVDHFKHVNDLYGHAAGDCVLVEVAGRLRAATRDGDAIFRMGGEEFLLLLPAVLDDTALLDIGEAVRHAIEHKPIRAGDEWLEVTVSVGAACTDAPSGDLEVVVAAADRALYAAKRSGRNRVCLASPHAALDEESVTESDALRLARAMAAVASASAGLGGTHLTDVSLLAARVARRLGVPPQVVLRCRLAGLLHDIGKLHVPQDVLAKAGPLDDAEWELMRAHPVHGAALVATVPELTPVAHIVRHHHERYDGGGYPDRLAGAAVPLEARILAAVDSWSAMRSDRPYRAALSEAAARKELARASGGQLDPGVVAALLSVLDQPRDADARREA